MMDVHSVEAGRRSLPKETLCPQSAYSVEKLGVEASSGADSAWLCSADELFGGLSPLPAARLTFYAAAIAPALAFGTSHFASRRRF